MSQEEKPAIEFPCAYPIKVLGAHEPDYAECVIEIIERHDPELIKEKITYRESKNGRYLSVNVVITATGEEQLKALFEELKATGRVQMVL